MFKILIFLFSAYVQVFGIDQYTKQATPNKPYCEVLIDRFENLLNDNTYFDFSTIKVRKVNKTRSFVGDVILKLPIGNDVTVETAAFVKQGGEYRLMPYRITPNPLCKFCAEDKYVYPDLAKGSDFPEDIESECPLQPKTYKFYGVAYELENVPKSAMQSGDYCVEATLKKETKIISQFRICGSVIQV